nr:hypothetical protein [Tanacetum cinerariifolium]
TLKLKRLRKVGTSQRVDTSNDTLMEDVSNQGRVSDTDEDAVKETEDVKEYTADTQVEGRQRRMIDELDKDEGDVLMNEKEETKEVKAITSDAQVEGRQAEIYQIDIDHAAKVLRIETDNAATVVPTVTTAVVPTVTTVPIKFVVPSTRQRRELLLGIQRRNHLQRFLLKPSPRTKEKSKEQMEEEENRAIASINETPAQKAAKRRRLNEEAEDVEEIKQHLEIMPDEDDDVYIEATPLARKP